MTTLKNAARHAVLKLDRPGFRWALSTLYPLVGRFSRYGAKSLRYEDGGWVHQFGENYLVELQPRLRGGELGEDRIREYCGQLYVPKRDDTIIDVGAGFGWESIFYARKVGPGGRIIAIEAHPALADALRRSITLNGMSQVTVVGVALADRAHTMFIENDLDNHRNNAVVEDGTANTLPVQAVSLDDLCDDLAVADVDFIKMNIEGAEQLAIRGMNETIKRTKVVAISCHDFFADLTGNPFFRTKAKVEEWLREHGMVIVSREGRYPWLRDQVNAYNPKLIDVGHLHPDASVS